MTSTSDLVKIYEQARDEVDTRITLVRPKNGIVHHVIVPGFDPIIMTVCEGKYRSSDMVIERKTKFTNCLALCRDCLKILREDFVP